MARTHQVERKVLIFGAQWLSVFVKVVSKLSDAEAIEALLAEVTW